MTFDDIVKIFTDFYHDSKTMEAQSLPEKRNLICTSVGGPRRIV